MLKKYFINKLILIVLFFTFCVSQISFADTVPLDGSVSKTVTISAQVVPFVEPIIPPIPPIQSNSISHSGSSIIDMPTVVNFFGFSVPFSKIYILQDGKKASSSTTLVDGKFTSSINLSTTNIYNFSIYAENEKGNKSSIISIPIYIKKGISVNVNNIYLFFKNKESVESDMGKSCIYLIGDMNCDNHVNLTDYTIMTYWYKRQITPSKGVDLNHDGKITLADFSILMYHWTD